MSDRPDLSGDWLLNREACTLSPAASATRSASLRIEHADPVIRCSARFVFADGNAFEFTTERTAIALNDTEPAAGGSAHWDGDGLVFTDLMGDAPNLVTMTWRYALVDAGRRLRAVERMRGGRVQDNVWVFDRAPA